jgi:phospholipase C
MSDQVAIEHIFVLMMENHSFDNALGFLGQGDGLIGQEYNLINPNDPTSQSIYVSNVAGDTTEPDPLHEFNDTTTQILGPGPSQSTPLLMGGFVFNYAEAVNGNVDIGQNIMKCYSQETLRALSTLAKEFCLCDRWFSSVPGPTYPNRFYVHAATSDGSAINIRTQIHDMLTIYNHLSDNGYTWGVYFSDFTECFLLRKLWGSLHNFSYMSEFFKQLESGDVPNYCFLSPRFISFLDWEANDQHPSHSMRNGKILINEVYTSIRKNQDLWRRSLLIVLYDEHGGFYDHVPPPPLEPFSDYKVLNPDGKDSEHPPFTFNRLGLRVPAILVSPYVKKGSIDSSLYEHSSIAATIKKLFNLPKFLTLRDENSNTFDHSDCFGELRNDTPQTLPLIGDSTLIERQKELIRVPITPEKVRDGMEHGKMSMQPLSDFQKALVESAALQEDHPQKQALTKAQTIVTEHDASVFVQERVINFLNR